MTFDFVHTDLSLPQVSSLDCWEHALTLGLPAAVWRLPNQQEKHMIVSFDTTLPRVTADLDELPAGFLVSPFANIGNDAPVEAPLTDHLNHDERPTQTLFLRADIQATFAEDGAILSQQPGHTTSALIDQFWHTLASRPQAVTSGPATTVPTATVLVDAAAQALYERNVAQAVETIRQGTLRKVVLSRTKTVQFSDVPNAIALFDKLCRNYPSAFVSAVSLPERGQIWISATPERLVSVDEEGIFRTMSLAGTQSAFNPDGTAKRPAYAMWSQKEIEEQALVNRYIIECFKKIRLREYVEEGPKTVIAGNLMHLSTCFTVDTHAVRYPQLGTVMLRLLHPTSAVCGTPRDAAFAFIRRHEAYDRELYSGFLGPVNMPTADTGPSSNLFVHIRCMKLEGKLATLFAGAGITEDSDPEREWQETEMKCQTLLRIMAEEE